MVHFIRRFADLTTLLRLQCLIQLFNKLTTPRRGITSASGHFYKQPSVCRLVRCADDSNSRLTTICFIVAFIAAPPVDIDGIREPVAGSLMYGNNIISGAVVPSSNAIGLHFYPIWKATSLDEWLYNGGPFQLVVFHFLIGICAYMGRGGNSLTVSVCVLGSVLHTLPVAAASAVFSFILSVSGSPMLCLWYLWYF